MIALFVPACRATGLQFRQDAAFRILAPQDRATVTIPFMLQWTDPANGLENGLRYGVFVDRPPPPLWGKVRRTLGRSRPCLLPDAPSPQCLREEGVYLTSDHSLSIEVLPPRFGSPRGLEDVHEITVVPLSPSGERLGESAAHVIVRIQRA